MFFTIPKKNLNSKFLAYLLENIVMSDQKKMKEYIRSLLENTMKSGHFDKILNGVTVKSKNINALSESESVNNFLDKEPGTETEQLDDSSKPQELGDPLKDIKMNQMTNLGSDGENAPTTAVKAGVVKGGNGYETGQRHANFQDKTEQA